MMTKQYPRSICQRSRIAFLLYLLFMALPVFPQIHVSQQAGNESGNGSFSQPYLTIQQAVNNASEGDTIFVMKGIYREQVEIPVDGIVITTYRDDTVTISGAEAVLDWELVGNEVYKAIVPWDIEDDNQANQVFVDGKMLHVARWPKEISDDFVANPTMASVDGAKESGVSAIFITDYAFEEPKGRWLNSKVWINLSHADHDGSGWTGSITFESNTSHTLKITDEGGFTNLNVGSGNYDVGRGTHYYLFDPAPAGVYATGGPEALLSRGEWWKNSDTLFVRLPDGQAPAGDMNLSGIVEVKKRLWAFIPSDNGSNRNNLTVSNFKIFASSICLDRDYYDQESIPEDSYNIIIDNIEFLYLFHATNKNENLASDLFNQRSGIILGGINHQVKNCIFDYSAASAISAFGKGHKISSNQFYHINYIVAEASIINSGRRCRLYDPEIDHNFFYKTPLSAIVINNIYNSDPDKAPGNSRIHHNIVDGFMLRAHDGGAFNASAGRDWENIRVDHNLIFNGTNFLAVGIYFDFGGNTIIDHNVIYNVSFPIALNRYPEVIGKNQLYNNVAITSESSWGGIQSQFRNGSGEELYLYNTISSSPWGGSFELADIQSCLFEKSNADIDYFFVDAENYDFQLNATATTAIDKGVGHLYSDPDTIGPPDIGAYEYGAEPWLAGPANLVTSIKVNPAKAQVNFGDTLHLSLQVLKNGFVPVEKSEGLIFSTNIGSFINDSIFVATDSLGGNGYIKVSLNDRVRGYVDITAIGIQLDKPSLAAMIEKGDVTLSWGTVEGANTYEIYQDGDLIAESSGNSFVISDLANGSYVFSIIAINDQNISSPESDPVTVSISVGINNLDNSRYNIHPNPVVDKIQLNFGLPGIFEIYSVEGILVMKGKLNSGREKIDISSLNPGYYILRARIENQLFTGEFIKE